MIMSLAPKGNWSKDETEEVREVCDGGEEIEQHNSSSLVLF